MPGFHKFRHPYMTTYPEPGIVTFPQTRLAGMRMNMSFAADRTGELWRSFMPRRKEIASITGNNLVSLRNFPAGFFSAFDPQCAFEQWAAAPVSETGSIPEGMESCIIPGGLYAVFHYKGLSTDTSIFTYIYREWLPGSAYELDQRPHFELLGATYKNNDPDSEEDIYIPVKSRLQAHSR